MGKTGHCRKDWFYYSQLILQNVFVLADWNPTIEHSYQPAPVNVALSASLTTTLGTSAGSLTSVNNGVLSDAWSSANNVAFPGYLTLDLGATTVSTNRITLAAHYGQGQGPTNVDVEYYSGSGWLPAVTNVSLSWNTNTTAVEYRDISFNSVVTNMLRLKINSSNLSWNHTALNELQWWTAE